MYRATAPTGLLFMVICSTEKIAIDLARANVDSPPIPEKALKLSIIADQNNFNCSRDIMKTLYYLGITRSDVP